MWYNKETGNFHIDRDKVSVAAHLRRLANLVEGDTLGCLTLEMLGDTFGTEFWLLLEMRGGCNCQKRIY